MQVKDVMNTKLELIRPETNAVEAARKMRDGDLGALPVMDEENVVGMVTDRDLAIRVLAEGLSPDQVQIQDIMTADVLSCSPEDSLDEAAELMAELQVRRLLVMDENKKLVGILSLGDMALIDESVMTQAMDGIAEKRHDEPGVELNH